MKKFLTLVLLVGLFVTASSVLASNDNKKSSAPAKVETTEKKAAPTEGKACCAEKKSEGKACCADKKSESKACCSEKKADAKGASCTNKEATSETKSSGKKGN